MENADILYLWQKQNQLFLIISAGMMEQSISGAKNARLKTCRID